MREYPTDTGPADYVLFVNREPVGVIEAKRDEAGENLTTHEAQTERYANATLKWRKNDQPRQLSNAILICIEPQLVFPFSRWEKQLSLLSSRG